MPQLHDYGGNIEKQWFVHYSYHNPDAGKMVRFREYKGLGQLKTAEEKYKHGQQMVDELTAKLKNGWNPFTGDLKVIYTDNLEYQHIAEKYGRERESAKDLHFYASAYLDRKKISVRPSTYTTYKSKFRYLCEFAESVNLTGKHPGMFTKEHVQRFLTYLNGRSVGNRSINEYITLMRALWEFMVTELVVDENPFLKVKRLRYKSNKPRIYNNVLIEKLKAIMQRLDPQMLLVVKLIFNCLIRPGELRFLKVKHVDFVRGRITVPAAVAKTNKERIIDIPDYLLQELIDSRYEQWPPDYYIISTQGNPAAKHVSRNYMYKRFKNIRIEAGLSQEYWLYAWKHTGMVELKLSGADWLDIRNQAGHQSLDQTIQYTQELMGVASEAIKKRGPRI